MKEFLNAMKELAIDVIFIVIVSCLVVFLCGVYLNENSDTY